MAIEVTVSAPDGKRALVTSLSDSTEDYVEAGEARSFLVSKDRMITIAEIEVVVDQAAQRGGGNGNGPGG